MGSDRARVSYDEQQQYRSVVTQQGRVTLEADWNEQQQIASEETRKEALDFVGPSGTPDDGYKIIETGGATNPPFDITIGAGTMYVGGIRTYLFNSVQYSNQSDWLDHDGDSDYADPSKPANPNLPYELVYLLLREQEVSAVEDGALREVALGGPDTAQRTRLLQRFVRLGTASRDCAGAMADAQNAWQAEGLDFDTGTMRLNPVATLLAQFSTQLQTNLCDPQATGGYLGADNQLIRVQISGVDSASGQYKFLWGFDDASFLYRADVVDPNTLHLESRPVDQFHQPRSGQAVEVLRSAALLSDGEYVASLSGFVASLTAPYDPGTQNISLPTNLPAAYGDGNPNHPLPPRVFLRVWEEEKVITPGTAISLGTTGLQVTLQVPAGGTFHVGDYWLIGVRPSTPTQVYPERYLTAPQPPEGPRLWACPLGVVEWDNGILKVDADCRNPFDNLVDLTKRKPGGGCCTVTVSPQDLQSGTSLQAILDGLKNQPLATLCLSPGTFSLANPIVLGPDHSGLTIEACHGGVTLAAASGAESNFPQGLVVVGGADEVTLKGITFQLSTLPLTKTGIKLNANWLKILGAESSQTFRYLETAQVGIGLRAVAASRLTVKECTFSFPRISAAGPALVVTASDTGFAGNNITVAATVHSDPDPSKTTFDLTVVEIETYTGLTLETLQKTLGTPTAPGSSPGLVVVPKVASAPGTIKQIGGSNALPRAGTITLTGGTPAKQASAIFMDANKVYSFIVMAKKPGRDGSRTKATVSNVNLNNQTFDLQISWTKTALGATIATADQVFAALSYEVNVAPPSGGTYAVPADSSNSPIALQGGSGGEFPQQATATLQTPDNSGNVLAFGLLAGGDCPGFTLEANQFVGAGGAQKFSPRQALVGFAVAPPTIIGEIVSAPSGALLDVRTPPSPHLQIVNSSIIPASLDDTFFHDNEFTGLAMAGWIYAEAGNLRIEGNSVDRCYAGFWILGRRTLPDAAELKQTAAISVLHDPLFEVAGALARLYPWPSTAAINKLVVKLPPASLALNTATMPKDRMLRGFDFIWQVLGALDLEAQKVSHPLGLHLFLEGTANRIEALMGAAAGGGGNPSSSSGLLVWCDPKDFSTRALVSANSIRNSTDSHALPTAMLLMITDAAVTGNLVLNDDTADSERISLLLVPSSATDPTHAVVAITGNVFRGVPRLPGRALPAPLDKWDGLNTISTG